MVSQMLVRGGAGFLVAVFIAAGALRGGSLSRSGAVAATIVGTAAAAVGWQWGALLIVYFIGATLLTRLGRAHKERLTGGFVAKPGPRDAIQVCSNGAVFAASLLLAPLGPARFTASMMAAALGALAASSADTWATELGTYLGGRPRSLRSLGPVPVGTSGAVSVLGSAAMIAGSVVVALSARALTLTMIISVTAVAGAAGAMADSLLGATLQERRWCATCERPSERRVHDCGTATTRIAGYEWMDNDLVNLLATVVGAAVAMLLFNLQPSNL